MNWYRYGFIRDLAFKTSWCRSCSIFAWILVALGGTFIGMIVVAALK